MPIKGLSDKRELSRGGFIRLGEKIKKTRQDGKVVEYPAKIDYMRFDPLDENLIPVFEKMTGPNGEPHGPQPKELKVVFAGETVEECFPQFCDLYSASGLICRGDGETANRIIDGTNKMEPVECVGSEECPFSKSKGRGGKPGCKQVGRLQFFLADMPVLQVFQINTSSTHSIVAVNTGLENLKNITGRIRGIEVTLRLIPRQVREPGGKKVEIFCLDIVIPCSLRDAVDLPTLIGGVNVAQLEAPAVDDSLPEDLYPASQVTKVEAEVVSVAPAPPAEVKKDPFKPTRQRALAMLKAHKSTREEFMEWLKLKGIDQFEKLPIPEAEELLDRLDSELGYHVSVVEEQEPEPPKEQEETIDLAPSPAPSPAPAPTPDPTPEPAVLF
jgi:hypothetical protein